MTSSLLSGLQISGLQALALRAMQETAQVVRRSLVSDGALGQTVQWTLNSTTVCRLVPWTSKRGRNEAVTQNIMLASQLWVLSLPAGTSLLLTDRILTGASTLPGTALSEAQLAGYGGRQFEIVKLEAPRTYEVQRVAYGEERFG